MSIVTVAAPLIAGLKCETLQNLSVGTSPPNKSLSTQHQKTQCIQINISVGSYIRNLFGWNCYGFGTAEKDTFRSNSWDCSRSKFFCKYHHAPALSESEAWEIEDPLFLAQGLCTWTLIETRKMFKTKIAELTQEYGRLFGI